MGIRFLLLAVAVWALFSLARRFLNRLKTPAEPQPDKSSVEMVSCERCGLHLPQPEALLESGRYYCCREHRDGKPTSRT